VRIIAPRNLTSDMAAHASQLYAKNLENFIDLITDQGELAIDFGDEVVAGACITHEGAVRNERAAAVAGLSAEPAPSADPDPVAEADGADAEEADS
jgi:NAD(P) transhydrogenase subunit alpha